MRILLSKGGEDMDCDNTKTRIENFRLWYENARPNYEAAAKYVLNRILEYLKTQKVSVAYYGSRAKTIDSAYEKAKKQIKVDNRYELKYSDPKNEIMDFAGVRIVVYLPSEIDAICNAVEQLFVNNIRKDDSENKADRLGKDKVGYLSIHYVIEVNTEQPEHKHLNGLKCEIQIRTVLQDAWAQIFHDRVYKGTLESDTNEAIERKINLLSGNLELIDNQINEIVVYYDSKNGNLDLKSYQQLLNDSICEKSLTQYCNLLMQGKVEKFYSYDQIKNLLDAFGIKTIRELDYHVDSGFIQELAEKNIPITFDRLIRYILIVSDYNKFFDCIDKSKKFVINETIYKLLDQFIDMKTVCSKYIFLKREEETN